jgi:thiamine-phosphate pyrophosphorylase
MNKVDFRLYVITDRKKTRGRPLEKVIEDSIRGGATAFQLREKDIPSGELFDLAQRIKAVTKKNGCRLIINDRADIVEAADADGLHLPKNGMPVKIARKFIGEEKLLGVSTHSYEEAREAEQGGADFITFGPLFYTPSKARYGPPVGLKALESISKKISIPIFGLGGIKSGMIRDILNAGAFGVSLISYIISAEDVKAATEELIREIQHA